MTKKIAVSSLIVLLCFCIMSCSSEDAKKISLTKTEKKVAEKKQGDEKPLRIAVGGMITPREGFAYYRKLLDYIGEKLGRKIQFVDREDYAEINELLKKREIDVAFVCGGPYVDGHHEFGMELLAAPRAYEGTVYYSYIIVHKDSTINNLKDLRGKTFAFTDPLSNTGMLVPTYMLAKMNETPDTFFKNYAFTKAHDKSIKAVATGIVDGAAVDSLIWEYADHTNSEYTAKTRIIKKSPPYGIPPVIVRPGLDPARKKEIRRVFLNVHKDPQGKKILEKMMIEKFVAIHDNAYDSIREMKAWIAKRK